jgi:hypothetical protein
LSVKPQSSSRRFDRSRTAVVIGRWGDDTALLRTEEGTTLVVPVPESLRDSFDVGAEAELDSAGTHILGLAAAERR